MKVNYSLGRVSLQWMNLYVNIWNDGTATITLEPGPPISHIPAQRQALCIQHADLEFRFNSR